MERTPERWEKARYIAHDQLNQLVVEGLIGDGSGKGMVLSFVTVAEVMGEDGVQTMEVMWDNGNRANLVLGNIRYGEEFLLSQIRQTSD